MFRVVADVGICLADGVNLTSEYAEGSVSKLL